MTLFRVLLTHSPRTGAEVFIPWDKTRLVSALSCWSSSLTIWVARWYNHATLGGSGHSWN